MSTAVTAGTAGLAAKGVAEQTALTKINNMATDASALLQVDQAFNETAAKFATKVGKTVVGMAPS